MGKWDLDSCNKVILGNYEVTQDIKQQLRFLEDLDKMEKKRHEEAERELLLRAAKSRYVKEVEDFFIERDFFQNQN